MPFPLLLAFAATAGATVLTYWYDRGASLWSRLCAGVCVGFAALGLVGFVLASLLGMTPAAVALAGFVTGSPLLLLLRGVWRARLLADAAEAWRGVRRAAEKPWKGGAGTLLFFAALALVFWAVFANSMYRTEAGIFTGLDTNLGDLPFHVSLVAGFAYGENFPPEHTEFAGTKLTYPFVVDFATAIFVRAGSTLEGAFFWQNLLMMLALAGLLYRWALLLTRDRAAAVFSTLFVIFSGGFGWWVFLREAAAGGQGILAHLSNLPHDYTRYQPLGYSWANTVTALFVPQRGILLGAGLVLIVWTLWWEEWEKGRTEDALRGEDRGAAGGKRRATWEGKSAGKGKRSKRPEERAERLAAAEARADSVGPAHGPRPTAHLSKMIAAGAVAGLLPLVHAHSFVVLMAVGVCLALLRVCLIWFGRESDELGVGGGRETARESLSKVLPPWAAFFLVAMLVAGPQMLWATSGSEVQAGRFFGWEFGWDRGSENVLWFWLKNTAFFIPLLAAALMWRGERAPVPTRLLYFYLPFTLCFVFPNFFKLSPWVWDNIKILVYWWIASAPLVALVVARIWRTAHWGKAAALALVLAQTAAGGLDVWRAASGTVAHRIFDADGLRFAELIRERTEPRALILHAPTYNDPVYLTGRRTFLGYTGHVWSHGLDYTAREAELKRVYTGAPDAARLLEQNGIDYAVVGPLERAELGRFGARIDEGFFRRFVKVCEAGEYSLYKTRP